MAVGTVVVVVFRPGECQLGTGLGFLLISYHFYLWYPPFFFFLEVGWRYIFTECILCVSYLYIRNTEVEQTIWFMWCYGVPQSAQIAPPASEFLMQENMNRGRFFFSLFYAIQHALADSMLISMFDVLFRTFYDKVTLWCSGNATEASWNCTTQWSTLYSIYVYLLPLYLFIFIVSFPSWVM